jgi:hypothetical protein
MKAIKEREPRTTPGKRTTTYPSSDKPRQTSLRKVGGHLDHPTMTSCLPFKIQEQCPNVPRDSKRTPYGFVLETMQHEPMRTSKNPMCKLGFDIMTRWKLVRDPTRLHLESF